MFTNARVHDGRDFSTAGQTSFVPWRVDHPPRLPSRMP
ncbi:hypothetical protein HTIA_1828 [Halorhabdus tiamatea SARL4B]|uniref:Uncharacterized protein n=1 Tax=Halorhabdus tiamatea SARL4B TaxID=1033806 RepID=S6D8S0_9EURY|nr:hypothetical protein HTIA_1828 [Halorhabdus tiamatea SARL4B]